MSKHSPVTGQSAGKKQFNMLLNTNVVKNTPLINVSPRVEVSYTYAERTANPDLNCSSHLSVMICVQTDRLASPSGNREPATQQKIVQNTKIRVSEGAASNTKPATLGLQSSSRQVQKGVVQMSPSKPQIPKSPISLGAHLKARETWSNPKTEESLTDTNPSFLISTDTMSQSTNKSDLPWTGSGPGDSRSRENRNWLERTDGYNPLLSSGGNGPLDAESIHEFKNCVSSLISENMSLIKDINSMRSLEQTLESQVSRLEQANKVATDRLLRIEEDNKQKVDRVKEVLWQEQRELRRCEEERDKLKQKIRVLTGGVYSSRGGAGSLQDLAAGTEPAAGDSSGRSGDTGSRTERADRRDREERRDGLQVVISSILKGKR